MRIARQARDMTIKDLAEASGMSETAIGNLENNKKTPRIESLRRLSKVLNVPIFYLGCFEQLPENTLGQRIMKARLFHGFTSQEFAKILNVNHKTLRSWEQDKSRPSSIYFNTLKQFLKVLEDQNFDCSEVIEKQIKK
ncbi:helix-turn-helix domain-containing protein [Thermoanaerobacter sp. RKWS2]|uniref:helix-turn-helix domain-containing protein n=1 Tax=Thermoanaerobacter sp. RKWS2 TaxID=2983842 RepID=UPI00224AD5E6|nr:helix-turn-helix transcriptional regulator [Thermoanaerobacter sp. RKWS2]UZQ84327.1 helix-turn-helix domain-containing protein [Thermoanaerobacter sp. RKWS2]